ncbi:hypothetical protein Srufu_004310 [Streptomyces libani subsp. rufus]|nr:hypothetical protein Srufu_004310 [Streptomyces libani subsp. rufus]
MTGAGAWRTRWRIAEVLPLGWDTDLSAAAAARARGRVGGRPTVITPQIIAAARDMLPNPDHSIASIAGLLGVSPGTLYNHVPDLQALRQSRIPRQFGSVHEIGSASTAVRESPEPVEGSDCSRVPTALGGPPTGRGALGERAPDRGHIAPQPGCWWGKCGWLCLP